MRWRSHGRDARLPPSRCGCHGGQVCAQGASWCCRSGRSCLGLWLNARLLRLLLLLLLVKLLLFKVKLALQGQCQCLVL